MTLQEELQRAIEGDVRFDPVSKALYSTDASVYQIRPMGVALPKTREDLIRIVEICGRLRCPLTMRGGGTAQAGQSIGAGLIVDTSKYYNRILELNADEQWVRVQPGIVLDELNAELRPYGLRFAPDVSTASRATIGGMMANNSSGARSVWYGKTIDHVLAQHVILSDASVVEFGPRNPAQCKELLGAKTVEGRCYRVVERLAKEYAEEIGRRYPRLLRRVGGYNLDEFVRPDRPFDMTRMMVGSEGTLGVVVEAKLNLVKLPRAKAVLVVQFRDLLEALGATPAILRHKPSAVEVMDEFILNHTRLSPNLQRLREAFVHGAPGAVLCVELYDDHPADLTRRLDALENELDSSAMGYRSQRVTDPAEQAQVWSLREAALGLSMTMKEDAKALSFVEDTAVAPEKLREYIRRFLALIRQHGTSAGVYAHASVGCLHVRPVINMKTEEGVRKFEAIANDVADLVLEFGGALSGEHGDGYVRSPFMQKMFGPVVYEAFRTIKRTFDPEGIFNPGKITDAPPLTSNLRFGAGYVSPAPVTFFDYSEYAGMGGAVEMCSGLGACRKKLEGTMCPSYMATREEAHTTRGRANVLRLAMNGRLGEAGLDDKAVYETLDLCLECRACKAECPVGVDMARFKSEFLAGYWQRHGLSRHARAIGNVRRLAELGSRSPAVANRLAASWPGRVLSERFFGIDRRRSMPAFARETLRAKLRNQSSSSPAVLLYNDTFTNFYEPGIGMAAWEVLRTGGRHVALAPNHCCARPLISKGLLRDACAAIARNTDSLHGFALAGKKIVLLEPSCLSAVREDAPALMRGEMREKAEIVARACVSFEEYAADMRLDLRAGPARILLHGHCHQKSMGLLAPAKALLSRIPGAQVVDLDAGCCGMAGSFGYARDHYDISRQIGERRLFPMVRKKGPDAVVVAAGTSCRHQVLDFADEYAVHPAVLIRELLA